MDWLQSIDCHLVETILNKREACRFGNSGAVSKKLNKREACRFGNSGAVSKKLKTEAV